MGHAAPSRYWITDRHLLLAGIAMAIMTGPAVGQEACQLVPDPDDPGWQVLSCRPDVGISASTDASFSLTDTSGDGLVDTIDLDAGAVRTRVEPADDPNHFQIRTNQAIVSVRGTDWATALSEAGTEVFVVKGEVEVVDLALSSGVILTPGLGVDVLSPPEAAAADEGGSEPDDTSAPSARALAVPELDTLQPVRWGDARAADLLARFPGS